MEIICDFLADVYNALKWQKKWEQTEQVEGDLEAIVRNRDGYWAAVGDFIAAREEAVRPHLWGDIA